MFSVVYKIVVKITRYHYEGQQTPKTQTTSTTMGQPHEDTGKKNIATLQKKLWETTVHNAMNRESILIHFYLFQKCNSDIINKHCHKK